MNCNNFNQYFNGEMDEKSFFAHRENCKACAKAFNEDKALMEKAVSLNTDLEIPDLWPEIQHELILSPDRKDRKHFSPQVFAWSAAAALLIVISIWTLTLPQPEPPAARILSVQALEQVREAEENYISAIEALEDMAEGKLNKTKEPLAQLYRNKIKLIDAQIRSCQNELERNPANAHIRKYLLAALQDMQSTLTEIIKITS